MIPALVKKENNEAELTITVSADEFDDAVTAVFERKKTRFPVDGFRAGKAPRSLVEKKYGYGIFFEDALNDLIDRGYFEAVDALGLDVVGQPDVSFGDQKIEAHKGFVMTVKVAVEPVVEVKDYKGIEAERRVLEVTDEMVDKDIDAMRERTARLIAEDRPAKKDDVVMLDYKGTIDGKEFEGGSAVKQPLRLGSGNFIPGFEEQLEGLKAGEEKDVVVTFPEDYEAKEYAGKEAVFHCKVLEVKGKILPELTDDFAKDVSEFDTMEELRADVRKRLEKDCAGAAEYDGKNAVLEKLIEANPFDIPEAMIDREAEDMVGEFARQLGSKGLKFEDYCGYIDKKPEELAKTYRPEAEKRIRVRLLVRAVGKAEGIEATEEEIRQELENFAALYKSDPDTVRQSFGKKGMELLEGDIISRKAMDVLYESAIFTDKPHTPEEEEAAEESETPETSEESKPSEESEAPETSEEAKPSEESETPETPEEPEAPEAPEAAEEQDK